MKIFFLLVWLSISLLGWMARADFQDKEGQIVDCTQPPCLHGIHLQPRGPFSALISCEDALGNYLGVMFYQRMGAPIQGKWGLGNRFWQDPLWGTDVTSFVWSREGNFLYVATSEIYGNGGVYELNLMERKSRRLYPPERVAQKNKGYIFKLKSIDFDKNILKVTRTLDQGSETFRVNLKSK